MKRDFCLEFQVHEEPSIFETRPKSEEKSPKLVEILLKSSSLL